MVKQLILHKLSIFQDIDTFETYQDQCMFSQIVKNKLLLLNIQKQYPLEKKQEHNKNCFFFHSIEN